VADRKSIKAFDKATVMLRDGLHKSACLALHRKKVLWIKRLMWAIRDFVRAWSGVRNRLECRAARRAILACAHRRLSDCRDQVRASIKAREAWQTNA